MWQHGKQDYNLQSCKTRVPKTEGAAGQWHLNICALLVCSTMYGLRVERRC